MGQLQWAHLCAAGVARARARAAWVRFDFTATNLGGATLWREARAYKSDTGCGTPSMQARSASKPAPAGPSSTDPACGERSDRRTDDPSIEPPLSAAEAAYQCAPQPPPCKLKWNPGKLCYNLTNASWPLAPPKPPAARAMPVSADDIVRRST